MDSSHYKTYVHILFSEENSLIYSYLEKVYLLELLPSSKQFPRHIIRMQGDLSVTHLVKIR